MKVGIITFPNSRSYGAILQMEALYNAVSEMGYDAEIINYHNLWMKQHKHTSFGWKSFLGSRWLKQKISYMLHIRMHMGFNSYERKMKKYPGIPVTNPHCLSDIGKRYSAVICGSDQVWNPDITNGDLSYFMDFCDDSTARISYAPSFGLEKLPDSFAENVKRELAQFSHISVREESGRSIVRELTGSDPQIVLDPSLLMDCKYWEKQEKIHPAAAKAEKYILYYTVKSSESLWRYCLRLAEQNNMKILRIGSNMIRRPFERNQYVEPLCDVTPDEWLYLMHHAQCVVTNSFHGLAFAVNYRKNVHVEFSSLTNTRLTNMVNIFGLQSQVVEDEYKILPIATDYTQTDRVLPVLKEESWNFLMEALSGISKDDKREYQV